MESFSWITESGTDKISYTGSEYTRVIDVPGIKYYADAKISLSGVVTTGTISLTVSGKLSTLADFLVTVNLPVSGNKVEIDLVERFGFIPENLPFKILPLTSPIQIKINGTTTERPELTLSWETKYARPQAFPGELPTCTCPDVKVYVPERDNTWIYIFVIIFVLMFLFILMK